MPSLSVELFPGAGGSGAAAGVLDGQDTRDVRHHRPIEEGRCQRQEGAQGTV